jgi:hypothetical protein
MFQLKWCIINSKYIFFLDLFLISTIIQIDGYNISVNFSLFLHKQKWTENVANQFKENLPNNQRSKENTIIIQWSNEKGEKDKQ